MLDRTSAQDLLKAAGDMAMASFCRVAPWTKKDRTWVTEADGRIQTYLVGQLSGRFPDAGLIAEEDHLRKDPGEGHASFVIDPIDGTASFVGGLPVWGIALGVIQGLKAGAGYFYMPATGDFFCTVSSGRVYRNNSQVGAVTPRPLHRESVLFTSSRFHRKFSLDRAYPGKVRCLGSTIAHICYVATGSGDAVFVSAAYIWDLVAGLAMAYANGAVARYLSGDDFQVDEAMQRGRAIDRPVLIGQPAAVEEYRHIIRVRKA